MAPAIEIPLASLGQFGTRLPEPGTVDVTIEVLGEGIGDQTEAEKLPWHALIYDEGNRILELSVGRRDDGAPVALRHRIESPVRVWAEEREGSVQSVSIEQNDGTQTIVRFHARPSLDAGAGE